jgi:PAS domain S-box-containing protein
MGDIGRARGEAQATESAAWLRVTLASIGDGVITTDRSGRVTFVNAVAQALTGWTQAAAEGRSLTEVFRIVNQDTRAEVQNPALRALREGLIVGLANHTILIALDGTERPIDDSAAPIRNEKGEVAGAVLVFRDITERHRQERLTREAFEYATSILETQREPFVVLDGELRVVSANRAFFQTFGVGRDQVEGRYVYELGGGEWNIPELRGLLEDVLTRDRAFDGFEADLELEGVGRRTMVLNGRRVRKPGNTAELILLAMQDVTERKQAERAVRESEVRYRRVFEAAKDGILILDAVTGKILDANSFMSGLTGLDHGDLLGKELHEIGLFQDVEENKDAFRQLQRAGYVRHEHLPIQNRRGEKVEIEMVANVYEEDGRSVAQCNVRDISERAAMQRKIAEQAEALAGESRRKDEFLAMLSHELRNPLAPIRSAVHLLRMQERAGSENLLQKQAHEVIERQVASLTKLVSDLLEVSRVVSGRVRLDRHVVDVNQILRHAVETTAPLFEQHRHTLDLRLGEPAWVDADPTRLEEVFINVLNNAAKYTPDGGRIEVSCLRPHAANHVRVGVRDNGVGIDQNLLRGGRIFDLFTQADRSLDRAAGGLGIGLSLAHRLMQLHGGTIEAQSPPEGQASGSEFVIKLPVVPPPVALRIEEDRGTSEPAGDRLRVLVVDDNIDLVMMLSSSLRHAGHSVQSAYTGPDGLKVARMWRPEVVLLDIGLPGLDGYEVARRLRADGVGPEGRPRILAMTGYGRDSDRALAREAGFDGHLVKPVDFDDLERMMAASAPLPPG